MEFINGRNGSQKVVLETYIYVKPGEKYRGNVRREETGGRVGLRFKL